MSSEALDRLVAVAKDGCERNTALLKIIEVCVEGLGVIVANKGVVVPNLITQETILKVTAMRAELHEKRNAA